MKKFCSLTGKYFGFLAIIFLLLGLVSPDQFKWVVGKAGGVSVLSLLLGVVMFGMGMALDPKDFALVLKSPLDMAIGACVQFLIMPGLARLALPELSDAEVRACCRRGRRKRLNLIPPALPRTFRYGKIYLLGEYRVKEGG